jgi:hypothetical protein
MPMPVDWPKNGLFVGSSSLRIDQGPAAIVGAAGDLVLGSPILLGGVTLGTFSACFATLLLR